MAQCRAIGRAPALAAWGARELYPGPDVDDEDLDAYVRQSAITYHHQVGTSRMGVGPDAVVDPKLRVRGVDGLWVADASVMPVSVNCQTMAACLLIGERAAQFML